uniref:Secreted protein n=1 Tax=Utricularia reniformis TaxID=192314 RepID=A0A1Y0B4C6_9LAMI|nr:hypothetical protein AEK19_MT2089 [Utricularia reniformis]ART32243.1 hypothetical protein AEK19_MT2089 [Utricularia reniformis]
MCCTVSMVFVHWLQPVCSSVRPRSRLGIAFGAPCMCFNLERDEMKFLLQEVVRPCADSCCLHQSFLCFLHRRKLRCNNTCLPLSDVMESYSDGPLLPGGCPFLRL